ncbi:MAG: hypothetical protein ACRYHC_12575 [Janthinobacterium lividum]
MRGHSGEPKVMDRRDFLKIAPASAFISTLGDTASSAATPPSTKDVPYVAPGSISGPLARGLMPPAGEPPLPQSRAFKGLRFTGRERTYVDTIKADTWYPSWGADGRLYSSYADGSVKDNAGHDVRVNSQWEQPEGLRERWFRELGWGVEGGQLTRSNDRFTTTGAAVLTGNDPFALSATPLAPFRRETPRYEGYYPCANLFHNGVWYYGGYYCHRWLDNHNVPVTYENGGFGGFRISTDRGATWRDTPHDDRRPLFPEVGRCSGGAAIKLGTPHFVDFGRDMEHSPDGYAYLVGHGSYNPDGVSNWCSGDAVSMARVRPSPGTMNDPAAWEYFAGRDTGGKDIWSRDFTKIRPLIQWLGGAGCVNVTYHPGLKRYFGFLCGGPADGDAGTYNIWVVESERLTGPWSSVACLRGSGGGQPYFVTMPSKFNQTSRKLVLFYSANWRKDRPGIPTNIDSAGPGGLYSLCVAEFELT